MSHNILDMNRKKSFFETQDSAEKSQVIQAWRAGEKVSSIAKAVGKSRDTIYRWLGESEKSFNKKKGRGEKVWSDETFAQVRELFVLLKAPSVRILKEKLKIYYSLSLSESQVRRLLQRLEIYDWKPSRQFDFIQKMEAFFLNPIEIVDDSHRESESPQKRPARSSGRASLDHPYLKSGKLAEDFESL